MTYLSDTVLAHVERVSEEPELAGERYELKDLLGRGGMGTVWQARDRVLDREVAVKVVNLAHLSEAKVIAKLEHPGIVPVHDSGVLPDGRAFYVMKLVRGERLDTWARGRETRLKLKLFERICEAVAFAHARGVLHRDLKPQNVMVGEFGEALVMDWGVAAVLGTKGFMAPEQAQGAPTPLSDVYSLGALLRALLESPPPALAAICSKAMADAPAERYASATALQDDVARFLALEPVLARRETLLERAGRFVSKNRVVLSLLAAYLVVRLALALLPR